jgi:hypothetical protein
MSVGREKKNSAVADRRYRKEVARRSLKAWPRPLRELGYSALPNLNMGWRARSVRTAQALQTILELAEKHFVSICVFRGRPIRMKVRFGEPPNAAILRAADTSEYPLGCAALLLGARVESTRRPCEFFLRKAVAQERDEILFSLSRQP